MEPLIRFDPTDVDAIAQFVFDSMPDQSGAVRVLLGGGASAQAVDQLCENLAQRGADAVGGAVPGPTDDWTAEVVVRGDDAGAVPLAWRPATNLRRLLQDAGVARRGRSEREVAVEHGLAAWPDVLDARNGPERTFRGHWPKAAKAVDHARALGVDPEELYMRVSLPLPDPPT